MSAEPIALRPTDRDGRFDLIFIAHSLGQIDPAQAATAPQPVTHVPEHL